MAAPEEQAKRQELVIHEIIAATAAQTLNLDNIMDTALKKVMDLMGVENGGIFLLDPKTGEYVLRRQEKLTQDFIREKGRVKLGEGCTGTAAKTGEIYCAYGMPERQFLCEDAERLMGIDCFVAAPIMVKGRAVGVIELFAPSARRITPDEAKAITAVANQIGIAIENARLYEESQENVSKLSALKNQLEKANYELREHLDREAYIAKTLQRGLVPLELPKLEGYEIATRYISATEAASIGGDFYDFIPIDDLLVIVVGDVSGSGIETSTLSSMVKNTIRAFALEDASPSSVITRANNVLYKEAPLDKYASLFYAILDPKKAAISYSNAGHPPPLIIRGGRERAIEELPLCTNALALTKQISCPMRQTNLEIGDSFIVYTDGLIEIKQDSDFYGIDKLKKVLQKQVVTISANEMADEIISNAQSFSRGRFADDITLIILNRK